MKESKFFEEVMAEGRIEALREAIREAVDVRFGPEAATECAPRLGNISDSEQLTELHRLAIKCRRFGEFRKRLASLVVD